MHAPCNLQPTGVAFAEVAGQAGGAVANQCSPRPFSMDEAPDTAVQDFLVILEEHRKNCEREGKYIEADSALSGPTQGARVLSRDHTTCEQCGARCLAPSYPCRA